jgi:hypothetical protein
VREHRTNDEDAQTLVEMGLQLRGRRRRGDQRHTEEAEDRGEEGLGHEGHVVRQELLQHGHFAFRDGFDDDLFVAGLEEQLAALAGRGL